MQEILRRRAALPALAALIAGGLGACSSTDSTATAGTSPDATSTSTTNSIDLGCFWGPLTNVTPETPDGNVGFPATGSSVTYVLNRFTLPAGAKIIMRGSFPYGRYMSFNSYYSDPVEGDGIPSDALYDQEIEPDEGSMNPYLPGADRTTPMNERAWTINVVGDKPPTKRADRAANTLYAGTLGSDQDQPAELFYRVYVADQGTDVVGDGGIPQPTLVQADGTELTGQALCDAVKVDTSRIVPNGLTNEEYQKLINLPANPDIGAAGSTPESPAEKPGQWYRPINPCLFTDPFLLSAGYPLKDCPLESGLTQWPTKDNAYIAAYIDRRFGPEPDGRNIVVMSGKMPTTPKTFYGNATFEGGTQMRYWSVCSNESLVTTAVTVDNGCVYDEQIPLDDKGNYRIVISTPEDRPKNATTECGVAWMNWGDGDMADPNRPTSAVLINRNMLPDPSFDHAVQNVKPRGLPKDVKAAMGEYTPKLTYTSAAEFDSGGC